MTAYPVPSSDPINNPTILAPYDETTALRKRVSILERPTGNSGYVTAAQLAAGTVPIGLSAVASLDFPSIAAGGSQTLTMTVTGAAVGDAVAIGTIIGAVSSDLGWNAWVSAVDTVSIRVNNRSGAPIDPPASDWKVVVVP